LIICFNTFSPFDYGGGVDEPSDSFPKLNICKIFDDFEFSFSAFIVTVNISLLELSGRKNPNH